MDIRFSVLRNWLPTFRGSVTFSSSTVQIFSNYLVISCIFFEDFLSQNISKCYVKCSSASPTMGISIPDDQAITFPRNVRNWLLSDVTSNARIKDNSAAQMQNKLKRQAMYV